MTQLTGSRIRRAPAGTRGMLSGFDTPLAKQPSARETLISGGIFFVALFVIGGFVVANWQENGEKTDDMQAVAALSPIGQEVADSALLTEEAAHPETLAVFYSGEMGAADFSGAPSYGAPTMELVASDIGGWGSD